MRGAVLIGAAALAASLGACDVGRAQQVDLKPVTPADVAHLTQIATAMSATEQESGITADQMQAIADSPDYAKLSPNYRRTVDELLAQSAFRLGRAGAAHAAFKRLTEGAEAGPDDWFLRLDSARDAGDYGDAYVAFRRLSKDGVGFEDSMGDWAIAELDEGFGRLHSVPGAQLELERYLTSRGWQPKDPSFSPDVIHLHQALNLATSGDTQGAGKILAHLTDPAVLAVAAADRRFDPVRAKLTDPAMGLRQQLETAKAEAARDPQSLAARNNVAHALEAMGRTQEALEAAEAAVADAELLSPEQRLQPFYQADYDQALAQKSRLLFSLGHAEEALGIAASYGCHVCGPNVGRALLQGRWLVAMGRGREALIGLRGVKPEAMWFIDRVEAEKLKACAAAQAGDEAAFKSAISYLELDGGDVRALANARLCHGDVDGAAEAVKAALADPARRYMALELLQRYAPMPKPTAFQADMAARLELLRARPDVVAAVDKVGRIQTLAMQFIGPIA